MDLSSTLILVTGGSSGLGLQTVAHLRNQGAKVVVIDKTASEDAFSFSCDITDEAKTKSVLDHIFHSIGVPRVCINCAGIAPAKRIVGKSGAMPLEEFQHVIDINLVGTFNVMRLVTEKMCQLDPLNPDGERGVIINTASIAAYEGQIGQAAYSASKGGVVSLTLTAARELAQFGIRVMTIAPGVMDTPMMAKMSKEVRDQLSSSVPFPKRLGFAEEYARLVQHIIENSYLNGSVIRLDGGLRMG